MELKNLNVLKFVKLDGFVLVFTETKHYNVLGQFNIQGCW